MKKRIFFIAMLTVGMLSFSSCQQSDNQNKSENEVTEEHAHHGHYYCPMKCEGDKTYEEPGKCPSCGMPLEKVSSDEDHPHDHGDHGHSH